MNIPSQISACDPGLLEAFLSGQLSEPQEGEFTAHLEGCEECRGSLEQKAAEPESWREAEHFLKPIPFDSTSAEEPAQRRQPAEIQMVLQALGPTDDPEMLGRLGAYEISGVVGAGGMGVVLKAVDPSLDRTVAIKVLAPHLATSGAARKRFAREAKAAAAVLHPNVIAIHSVSNDESVPYLVMPYVRGASLQRRLDREGPLPLAEVLRIGAQIAAGLAAAHAQGLVHRDIKPANILLEEGIERVTITDFGLARAVDDATITHSGVAAGTPQYMSPEQARGEPIDQRSDLFSLGSVLYAICAGRPPFRAETTYGVLRRITDDEPASLREINPEVPEWLCAIIGRLMAKRAADRYQSAAEVAELLAACLAHVQQPSAVALPLSLADAYRESIFSFVGKGVAMLAAIAIALFGFGLWQATVPPDIAGAWNGPEWGTVILKKTGDAEYEGTYTDTFGKAPGKIRLQWSRIESRFNGGWSEGDDRFGELSVRLVGDEIRGAHTTDAKSKINPATPRLADLAWTRDEAKRRSELRSGIPGLGSTYSAPDLTKWSSILDPKKAAAVRSSAEVFSPVLDAIVLKNQAPTWYWFDLDTGKTISAEKAFPNKKEAEITEEDWWAWRAENRVDVAASFDEPATLKSLDKEFFAIPVTADQWDRMTPSLLHEVMLATRPANQSKSMPCGDRLPATFIFKTGQGNRGILQITDISSEPHGLKIRYKLVRTGLPAASLVGPGGDPKTAVAPLLGGASLPPGFFKTKRRLEMAAAVESIVCTPDGKLIAIASRHPEISKAATSRMVEIIDTASGQKLIALRILSKAEEKALETIEGLHDTSSSALAFSPDGSILAVGTGLGQAKLYDVKTGELIRALDDEAGKKLEKRAPEKVKPLLRAMGSVEAITFSPDGKWMVTVGHSFADVEDRWDSVDRLGRRITGPGRVKIWDVKTGKLTSDLAGHSDSYAAAFSADGSLLATAGRWSNEPGSGTGVIVWSPQTGKPSTTLQVESNGFTYGVCFSPTAKLLAMATTRYNKENDSYSSEIGVAFALSGITEWKQTIPGSAYPKGFSPDGKWLAVLCGGKSIRFFETSTGREFYELKSSDHFPGGRWTDMSIASQGSVLAISSVDPDGKGSVTIFELSELGAPATPKGLPPLPGSQRGSPSAPRRLSLDKPVETIAVTPDGKVIAVSEEQRGVKLIDAANGQISFELELDSKEEADIVPLLGDGVFDDRMIAFSADGSILAVAPGLGRVKFFDTKTGKLIRTLNDEAGKAAETSAPEKVQKLDRAMGRVTTLVFSPDGKWLATVGSSFGDCDNRWHSKERTTLHTTGPGRLKIWDVATGKLQFDFPGHSDAHAAAFSENGALIASGGRWIETTGGRTGVFVWDPSNGKRSITHHVQTNGHTFGIAFAPGSKLLAMASAHYNKENDTYSSEVCVAWALSGITEWKRTYSGSIALKGFSPDGKLLVLLCEGDLVRFLDTSTGREVYEIRASDYHPSGSWADMAIARTGRILVIGTTEEDGKGSVLIYDLSELGAPEKSQSKEERKK